MTFRMIATAVSCLFCYAAAYSVTLEENFGEYSDFDPAHHRWMFRGVGGEVIDGEYRFNGVSIEEPIQADIRPLLVLGMPRDFPAGPTLRLEAEIAVGRKGYSFLPEKWNCARRIGVAILPRAFSRGRRDPANLPMVLLTLDRGEGRGWEVEFGCEGKWNFTPERKVLQNEGNWRDDAVYRFALSLDGELIAGTIRDEAGKVLYRAELRGKGFSQVFRTAYPAFANLRQEGGDPEIPGGKQWADCEGGPSDSPDVPVADRARREGPDCTPGFPLPARHRKNGGRPQARAPGDHLL